MGFLLSLSIHADAQLLPAMARCAATAALLPPAIGCSSGNITAHIKQRPNVRKNGKAKK
jgi:hypothetical protein